MPCPPPTGYDRLKMPLSTQTGLWATALQKSAIKKLGLQKMSGPKLLFVGLDSADPTLIHRWAAAGHLPCLHKLTTEGAWANVTVPPGFSNGCVWPSLYTGVNPGRHGRYASKTALNSSYDYTVAFDEDRHLRADPFWISAGDQGARVGVVDMVRHLSPPASTASR